MGLIAPLAALLGLEVEGLTARAKSAILVYGLVGLFSLVAVGFLLAAGYMALADIVGPIYSALIFAGTFLLLALAVYLGSLIGRSKRQREVAQKRRASETSALITTAAITALPIVARSPLFLKVGLPLAAVAAFAFLRDTPQDGDRD
ncbi:hypothetical protein [Devosia sediminis]|uniref:Phage holin family protein n=1 Tax=Devosia sediminis TaxID=2798801 RepID=A0A934IM36_9HYPH|nr:hypothetical protein [Devosia sediminis]MBJ3783264.1 hypothetical protein [Devosia sediminis]